MEAGYLYDVAKWKPTADLNEFENYYVYVLKPQNNESGETELKNIS